MPGEQPVYRWSPRTRRTVAMFIGILAALVLWGAREIVGPFVWAGIFAYVFNPAVNGLVRLARVPRPAAVALFYALGLGLLILLGFLVVPRVVDELNRLADELPSIVADVEAALPSEFLGQPLVVQDVIDGLTAGATSMLTDASQAVSAFRSAFNLLIHGVLAVVAAGYLLLAGPELFRGLLERIPPGPRAETEELVGRINNVLGAFIRGEIILVVIMSVTTFIGLSIIGIPFAVILAIATGFLELIPVFGPIMAAIPPIGLALVTANNFGWPGWVAGVVVAVMYTVLRQLEDYFVIPNVVGRVVRVHPPDRPVRHLCGPADLGYYRHGDCPARGRGSAGAAGLRLPAHGHVAAEAVVVASGHRSFQRALHVDSSDTAPKRGRAALFFTRQLPSEY